jgi:hypothetical protein
MDKKKFWMDNYIVDEILYICIFLQLGIMDGMLMWMNLRLRV